MKKQGLRMVRVVALIAGIAMLVGTLGTADRVLRAQGIERQLELAQKRQTSTIRERPLSTTPTWDIEHGDGTRSTIRQRPLSSSPTWDIENSDGTKATVRQRPLSTAPTYETERSDGSRAVTRQRPLSSTPTWETRESDGTRTTTRQRPLSSTPTWDVEGSDGTRSTIRQRPLSSTPTWESETQTPRYRSTLPSTGQSNSLDVTPRVPDYRSYSGSASGSRSRTRSTSPSYVSPYSATPSTTPPSTYRSPSYSSPSRSYGSGSSSGSGYGSSYGSNSGSSSRLRSGSSSGSGYRSSTRSGSGSSSSLGSRSSGHEAWHPHAILMDMRMPEMDGYEATRRLKATRAGRSTPVVAITASVLDGAQGEVHRAGADAYIRKPFQHDEVFETLRRVLDVTYEYAGEEGKESGTTVLLIMQKQMATWPKEMVTAMRQALEEGDMSRMPDAIEPVKEIDPASAAALQALTEQYDYETLGRLFG